MVTSLVVCFNRGNRRQSDRAWWDVCICTCRHKKVVFFRVSGDLGRGRYSSYQEQSGSNSAMDCVCRTLGRGLRCMVDLK